MYVLLYVRTCVCTCIHTCIRTYVHTHEKCHSPTDRNHVVYFDNFFTSIKLAENLEEKNIFMVGTIRTNKLHATLVLTDKATLKNMQRGEYLCRTKGSVVIRIVYIIMDLRLQVHELARAKVFMKRLTFSDLQVRSLTLKTSLSLPPLSVI